MILEIPNVLPPDQLAAARKTIESAEWIDGRATAGHQGARVKDNQQLPVDHPVARQVGEQIARALMANPLFMSAALPLHILPPMFNRYAGGPARQEACPEALRRVRGGTGHLARGQSLEAAGDFFAAIARYDAALAATADSPRALGLASMNRGNALQKASRVAEAVHAYDEAIAHFRTLPIDLAPVRNHLGAACLNRGHALLADESATARTEATRSFERAIAWLRDLPLDENPAYRLNLAGAWANLAHLELDAAPSRAHASASTALALVAPLAAAEPAFAGMDLRARRALVMALGALLGAAEAAGQPIDALAAEATDTIDEGLARARGWEVRGLALLRPLAARLFRLGAQLYRVHQPHFLAEFVWENLSSGPFAGDAVFHSTASEALALALADLQRPRRLLAGSPDAEKLLETARVLRAAQARLSTLSPSLSTDLP